MLLFEIFRFRKQRAGDIRVLEAMQKLYQLRTNILMILFLCNGYNNIIIKMVLISLICCAGNYLRVLFAVAII